jgi:ATP-dependent helicase HrpB
LGIVTQRQVVLIEWPRRPGPAPGHTGRVTRPAVPDTGLPVETVVGEVRAALGDGPGHAVLVAPPGAGKTTVVPLRLLDEAWVGDGRIVVLEPRRLAARAAAVRMADLLGEAVGQTVGYRTRDERRTSAATRIEVITEGILVRRLQSDPTLDGTALVVLDEVHERNLTSDLSLALLLDARAGLRPDLRVLAMSATLDADRLAAVVGGADGPAPVVRSDGRQFPVTVVHRPPQPRDRLDAQVARAVASVLAEHPAGDVLVFLPGAADIRRAVGQLRSLPGSVDVRPLFGALPVAEQDLALAPSPPGRRRVVLATDIAESSLTVAGVQIVVDAGLVRVPRYDPASGLTGLRTETASRAAADQRAGRAGRLGPGHAVRLWSEADHLRRPAFPVPEIAVVDLAGLALELAVWGAGPDALSFLDQPPRAAWSEAGIVLRSLGAIDDDGRPTSVGRAMADLPLHPRLARLAVAGRNAGEPWTAALVAALLEERDVLRGRFDERPVDLVERVAVVAGAAGRRRDHDRGAGPIGSPSPSHDDAGPRRRREGGGATVRGNLRDGSPGPSVGGGVNDGAEARRDPVDRSHPVSVGARVDDGAVRTVRRRAKELVRRLGGRPGDWYLDEVGPLVALAYPDRVAQQRGPGRFRLRAGGGGHVPDTDPLATAPWLAVAGLEVDGADARITTAAVLDSAAVRRAVADAVEVIAEVTWDRAAGDLRARRVEQAGALVLSSATGPAPAGPATVAALIVHVRSGDLALPWTAASRGLQARAAFIRSLGHPSAWADLSDEALLADLDGWLAPFLGGATGRRHLERVDLLAALRTRLGHDRRVSIDLEQLAPTSFVAADGRAIAIDYATGRPVAAARVQDLYGLTVHPMVGGGAVPVVVELRSPADRPVQVTADLPGFWSGTWAEVRRELAGRYPKHRWPEDGAHANPGRGRRRPN